jgi:adenosylcobinamide-phosphate synthase
MPLNAGCQVFLAYLLDLALGDPRWLPHPVVFIGKAIVFLERLLRLAVKSPALLRAAGALTAFVIVGGSWLFTFFLLQWSSSLNQWLGKALSIWLIYTTLAARGLAGAAKEVYSALVKGDLAEARRKVGWIVGRDTDKMDDRSVTRATVETVAENIVDGIISPMFYALIGGAPLAMAYRAVNTLDSMLGYKNERYIDFGRASARLDDLANYIPARLTGLLLLAAAFLLRMRPKRADGHNPGFPAPSQPQQRHSGSSGSRLPGDPLGRFKLLPGPRVFPGLYGRRPGSPEARTYSPDGKTDVSDLGTYGPGRNACFLSKFYKLTTGSALY